MRRQHGITMRTYLVIQTMVNAECHWSLAIEAVNTTALEHPEWDLTERRTWAQWERHFGMPPLD